MSNFTFLKSHFAALYAEARRAERSIDGDPRTSCFYARRAVELWANWLYDHERRLRRPYEGDKPGSNGFSPKGTLCYVWLIR